MTPDDRTLGELGRAIDRLATVVDKLDEKLDHLANQFVPRETWDIAQGSNRVDIGRLDLALVALERRMDEAEKEAARRFRQNVVLLISSFLAPIVVGLVLIAMSSGAGP